MTALHRALPLLAAALGLAAPAHADDRAARTLDAVRAAYRSTPIDEHLTIEVRGQADTGDISEGRLRLNLQPPADPPAESPPSLELTIGPVRAIATATALTVTHATDPDQYVGLAIDALTLEQLQRTLPSIPLPQLALALTDSTADTLEIPSLLPAITLREISRGQTTITLSGRNGPAAATLIISLPSQRIERFEATIPADSGWYELIVTATPAHSTTTIEPQSTTGRQRVARLADLRPRGLVLVPQADLGWLPIHSQPPTTPTTDPITLGALLTDRGPMVVAILELAPDPTDPAWLDQARQAVHLLNDIRGDGWSLLLLFDPAGRRAVSFDPTDAALAAADLADAPWAWVDGRTAALSRALPRLDPGVLILSRDALILDAALLPADDTARAETTTRLRAALDSAR